MNNRNLFIINGEFAGMPAASKLRREQPEC